MKLPKPSKVTRRQAQKVLKAALYAFASTFITTLLVVPDLNEINQRTVLSAFVAGVNAVLVFVKQLFTQPE